MSMHGVWLASMAVAASFRIAAGTDEALARETAAPVVRETTLAEDIVAGMRELLAAAVPEISLPTIEIELPKLPVEQD